MSNVCTLDWDTQETIAVNEVNMESVAGDDCVSIVSGSRNIGVYDTYCGIGCHGIRCASVDVSPSFFHTPCRSKRVAFESKR